MLIKFYMKNSYVSTLHVLQSFLRKAEIHKYETLGRCKIPKDSYSPVYYFHHMNPVAMPSSGIRMGYERE